MVWVVALLLSYGREEREKSNAREFPLGKVRLERCLGKTEGESLSSGLSRSGLAESEKSLVVYRISKT